MDALSFYFTFFSFSADENRLKRGFSMNCSTILSLVLSLVQLGHCYPTTQNFSAQNTDQSYTTIQRVKRGWVWEPLFVTEEQTSTMPTYVGQV